MDFSESRKISHANLIKNLRTRADQKTNGKNDSQIKTCLVVQGGGMRAAYSMGCLLALDEFGYRGAFDYILGSSAGAINAAYFLAGQSKMAARIYADYLTQNDFIDFFRPRNILSTKRLMEVLSHGKMGLNVGGVGNAPPD